MEYDITYPRFLNHINLFGQDHNDLLYDSYP